MNSSKDFTDEICHEEWPQVHSFMERFFHYYYVDRSVDHIFEMLSPTVICVGLQSDEIALNASDLCAFAEKQMLVIARPIQYHVVTYSLEPCGPHCWLCFYHVSLQVHSDDRCKVEYRMRLTSTVRKVDGAWKMVLLHVSEAADKHEDIRLPSQLTSNAGAATQEELDRLMSKLFPGCVIGITFQEGFPVLIANDQFLCMTGYRSVQELREQISDRFLNCVVEEDRALYTKSSNFVLKTGKQCESDYWIYKKDGSQLWVHDTAQLVLTEDSQSVLISSLLDISQHVYQQNKLAIESVLDSLTGVCNRNGVKMQIDQLQGQPHNWVFRIMDLDNFKLVNDLYGHLTGDVMLAHVGAELKRIFGALGIPFRLGGDEFGLYLYDFTAQDQIRACMDEIIRSYKAKAAQECPDAQSSLSAGGIHGSTSFDFVQAYSLADINLYKVKNSTKGNVLITPYQ